MKLFTKALAVILLALMMSACGTISRHAHVQWTSHSEIAPSIQTDNLATKLKPLPVETEQVQVKAPELKLPDVSLLPHTLAERARVYLTESEITCMAQAVYFEARGEGTLGQVGVAYVVLNRMGHKKFPRTACGVVYQKNRRGCQFSWTCDHRPDKIRNLKAYQAAREIALQVLMRSVPNPIGESIFFRHRLTRSRYASRQMLVATIGQHRFFAARYAPL